MNLAALHGSLNALVKLAGLLDLAYGEEWLDQPVLEDDLAGDFDWHTDLEREFAAEREAILGRCAPA